ncbi:MAG: endonuclease domain-containing protein [Candidatus Stahlbacteria bacterium]|nr:MAG: endonuclease domain-containing protein [Candidatus Stahlbacteria bacterium]
MRNRLYPLAKGLRKNMTQAERKLWKYLKNKQLGVKFRRQYPIDNYIVDFVCLESRLVVEIDGGQHSESRTDTSRDEYLRSQGFKVLRFWNTEVLENIEGVLDKIRGML